MSRFTITNGATRLDLDPMAGGAVSALRHGHLDILRPAPQHKGSLFDARLYAAFPMLPFVGRIYRGRFVHSGTPVELPSNMPPEPHSIHGHGWQNAWAVSAQGGSTATLSFHHSAGTWPWKYEAAQTFSVLSDGLRLSIDLKNLSDTPMPAGIGWHPYFLRSKAVLTLDAATVWSSDPLNGQTRPSPIRAEDTLSEGRSVEALKLDTTFTLGSRRAHLKWPTHEVIVEPDPLFMAATVYVPPNEDFFCIEPVSHVPYALNSALPWSETGMRLLAPGETLRGSITLRVSV